jgi:hypothetical protein
MIMITEVTLRNSAEAIEAELTKIAKRDTEAKAILKQMQPYIDEAKSVLSIDDFEFRRLRFDYPLIDGVMADYDVAAILYSRFANQFEGLLV